MIKMGDDIIDYAVFKHAESLNGTMNDKMKAAAKFFGITLGNLYGSIENGRELHDSVHPRSPMTGINKDLLFDFYLGNQPIDEIVVLLAHLAIKSILGQKSFCRVTNDYLLCRMAGYPGMIGMEDLPAHLSPYSTRRRLNNIKTELQRSYGLQIYARYTRGFFVSDTLTLEQLIMAVETKRKKWHLEQQKTETSEAVKKVLSQLYGNDKN
jgi:hypothetical protein